MTDATELEWSYEPTDFFEVSTVVPFASGKLTVEAGKATYALDVSTDPVPDDLQRQVASEVSAVFEARQVLTDRAFTLAGPTIVQYGSEGSRRATVTLTSTISARVSVRADLVIRDSSGEIVTDTRAERTIFETNFVRSLAPKLLQTPTLRTMIGSYRQALLNPNDELVYLYEARDAAVRHYGQEAAARSALGISREEWSMLGRLANVVPLRQGRHRGRYGADMRDATQEEIRKARNVVRKIIEGFATLT